MAKGMKIPRTTRSCTFVLGQSAFRKISAVEGIKPSKRLDADLARVKIMPAEKRRIVLAGEYGKKK